MIYKLTLNLLLYRLKRFNILVIFKLFINYVNQGLRIITSSYLTTTTQWHKVSKKTKMFT